MMKIVTAHISDHDDLIALMRLSLVTSSPAHYGVDYCTHLLAADNPHFVMNVPPHSLIAKDEDGTLLGFAGWQPQERQDGLARISAAFVHPDYCGKGIGRALMAAVEADIRHAGFCHVHLVSTKQAEKFYLAQGYQFAEWLQEEFVTGEIRPFARMEKILKD